MQRAKPPHIFTYFGYPNVLFPVHYSYSCVDRINHGHRFQRLFSLDVYRNYQLVIPIVRSDAAGTSPKHLNLTVVAHNEVEQAIDNLNHNLKMQWVIRTRMRSFSNFHKEKVDSDRG